MSRMTKFLRQKCVLEQCIRNEDGSPDLNDYGEFQYKFGVVIPCRHESSFKDVQTVDGSVVRSTATYYVDEKYKVAADDRIDGKVIVSVAEYINSLGKSEGYEVLV